MTRTYDMVLKDIRREVHGDVEGQLRLGALVSEALALQVTKTQLAADSGIGLATLRSWQFTAQFWGMDRVDGLTWHQYSRVARWPNAKSAKRILLRKGAKAFKQLQTEATAIRQRVEAGVQADAIEMLSRDLALAEGSLQRVQEMGLTIDPDTKARLSAMIRRLSRGLSAQTLKVA